MIGIDIEEVARFRKLNRLEDRRFFERIFTKREMDYCFLKKDPAPHLAGRFCAKEAIIKALASMGIHTIARNAIEIINTAKGVPKVVVLKRGKKLKIQISISHARDYALACAVVV